MQSLNFEQLRVRRWITSNRGILTQVALRCKVSVQFVNQVAYGTSTALPGNEVEMCLRNARVTLKAKSDWPGIRRS